MKIELTPVVELIFHEDEFDEVRQIFQRQSTLKGKTFPRLGPYCAPRKIDFKEIVYELELLSEFDREFLESKIRKHITSFYEAESLSICDWETLIRHHVSDQDIMQSIALYGGFGLRIDGKFWLLPQCCSTLADINAWRLILDESNYRFGEKTYLVEGHPSPEISRDGDDVVFECSDPYEKFDPLPEKEFFRLPCKDLSIAIEAASEIIRKIEADFESLAPRFGASSLRHLLWENS